LRYPSYASGTATLAASFALLTIARMRPYDVDVAVLRVLLGSTLVLLVGDDANQVVIRIGPVRSTGARAVQDEPERVRVRLDGADDLVQAQIVGRNP
jgi:hypothetical protein